MGASGSTAASCSSLDLTNISNDKLHRYSQQQQLAHSSRLQIERLHRYKRRGVKTNGNKKSHLKLSSSHFDLTSADILSGKNNKHRTNSYHPLEDSRREFSPSHLLSSSNISANDWQYSCNLSDDRVEGACRSNSGVSKLSDPRHIMVLPSTTHKPMQAAHLNAISAKKSNAGVASRILHLRQQRKTSELKKFSGSLPSLHNMISPDIKSKMNPTSNHQLICNQHPNGPIGQVRYDNHRSCHNDATHSGVKFSPNKPRLTSAHKTVNLVQANISEGINRCKTDAIKMQPKPIRQHHDCSQGVGIIMKRAASLSLLHESNNLQHQYRRLPNHGYHPHANILSRSSYAKNKFSDNKHCSSKHQAHQNLNLSSIIVQHPPPKFSNRPNSMNFDYAPTPVVLKAVSHQQQQQQKLCDLHSKQVSDLRNSPSAQQNKNSKSNSKKDSIYKQATRPASQPKNNRYKSKVRQSNSSSQQQGCQVLPPLPKTQSLRELIQLRATENGQRMRTTGTLRGYVSGAEPATSKVNLVAELLESRRQQLGAINDNEEHQQQISTDNQTIRSQSSSTDDGIHDVSISGEGNPVSKDEPRCVNEIEAKQSFFKKQSDYAGSRLRRLSHQSNNANNDRKVSACSYLQQQNTPNCSTSAHADLSQQHHGSTLKRSASHSTLQHTGNPDSYDRDGDESDDLNELASFLYQFKQRQAKNFAANNQQQQVCEVADLICKQLDPGKDRITKSKENPILFAKLQKCESVSSNTEDHRQHQKHDHKHDHTTECLQQSPNSTTSSSGFASSTSTSHSISSNGGSNGLANRQKHQLQLANSHSETCIESVPKHLVCEKRQALSSSHETTTTADGNIKHASSLLSIVDECQQSADIHDGNKSRRLSSASPTAGASNLCEGGSSLLESKKSRFQDQVKEKNETKESTSIGSYLAYKDCDLQNSPVHHQQLERLKKYTQLRQMSQSELALNHLGTSSTLHQSEQSTRPFKGKLLLNEKKMKQHQLCANMSGESKPYASRLFNLIRRISDKSEIVADRKVVGGSGRNSSIGLRNPVTASNSGAVGGQKTRPGCQIGSESEKLSAINQTGPNHSTFSSHSNQATKSSAKADVDRSLINGVVAMNGGKLHKVKSTGNQFLSHNLLNSDLKRAACISESLCDLNFDCDLELIKNFGSRDEQSVQEPEQQATTVIGSSGKSLIQRVGVSSLLPAVVNFHHNGQEQEGCAVNMRSSSSNVCVQKNQVPNSKKQQTHQQVINASNGENNWRLVSAFPSLATTTNGGAELQQQLYSNIYTGADDGCGPNSKSNNNNNNDNSKKQSAIAGPNESKNTAIADSKCGSHGSSSQQLQTVKAKPQGRPKWSASSWLMSGSSNGSRVSTTKQSKAGRIPASDSHQRQSSGKSYFSKLIPGANPGGFSRNDKAKSKAKAANVGADRIDSPIAEQSNTLMLNEADRLLHELDHSLDLVSNVSCCRFFLENSNGAVQRWRSNGLKGMRNFEITTKSHEAKMDAIRERILLSDSDEDDAYADYASINQAMINETFDVDLNADSVEPKSDTSLYVAAKSGSPSNSFTFRPLSSPSLLASSNLLEDCKSFVTAVHADKSLESSLADVKSCKTSGIKADSKCDVEKSSRLLSHEPSGSAVRQETNGENRFECSQNIRLDVQSENCAALQVYEPSTTGVVSSELVTSAYGGILSKGDCKDRNELEDSCANSNNLTKLRSQMPQVEDNHSKNNIHNCDSCSVNSRREILSNHNSEIGGDSDCVRIAKDYKKSYLTKQTTSAALKDCSSYIKDSEHLVPDTSSKEFSAEVGCGNSNAKAMVLRTASSANHQCLQHQGQSDSKNSKHDVSCKCTEQLKLKGFISSDLATIGLHVCRIAGQKFALNSCQTREAILSVHRCQRDQLISSVCEHERFEDCIPNSEDKDHQCCHKHEMIVQDLCSDSKCTPSVTNSREVNLNDGNARHTTDHIVTERCSGQSLCCSLNIPEQNRPKLTKVPDEKRRSEQALSDVRTRGVNSDGVKSEKIVGTNEQLLFSCSVQGQSTCCACSKTTVKNRVGTIGDNCNSLLEQDHQCCWACASDDRSTCCCRCYSPIGFASTSTTNGQRKDVDDVPKENCTSCILSESASKYPCKGSSVWTRCQEGAMRIGVAVNSSDCKRDEAAPAATGVLGARGELDNKFTDTYNAEIRAHGSFEAVNEKQTTRIATVSCKDQAPSKNQLLGTTDSAMKTNSSTTSHGMKHGVRHSADGKKDYEKTNAPRITYYHYSHEMGKFAPTDKTNGQQQQRQSQFMPAIMNKNDDAIGLLNRAGQGSQRENNSSQLRNGKAGYDRNEQATDAISDGFGCAGPARHNEVVSLSSPVDFSSSEKMKNDAQLEKSTKCRATIDSHAQRQQHADNNRSSPSEKLRSSALNQNANSSRASKTSSTTGSTSQASLVNHCSTSGFSGGLVALSKKRLLAGCGHNNELKRDSLHASHAKFEDVDDNFILRRKTPDAGLRTHC